MNHYSLVRWPLPRSSLLTVWAYSGVVRCPQSPPITQVASMPLSLVSAQAPLLSFIVHIQWSCRFSPCSSWLATLCVMLQGTGEGVCVHNTKWTFQQTLPPHFCLKVVCKKGWAYFESLWYVLFKIPNSQMYQSNWTNRCGMYQINDYRLILHLQ